jgi:hypothetical protein
MPEIDIFLSRCGLGELEYIYKRVKPLFEGQNDTPAPELVPPQVVVSATPIPGTTEPGSNPDGTDDAAPEVTTAPLAEETTQ